jgi:galactose mutarotase-like enzyme
VSDVEEEVELQVASGELEATFLPGHGLRGVSLRHRGEELLAPPRVPGGREVDEVRGLPLLAPWANRLGGRSYSVDGVVVDLEGLDLTTDANGLPIHGTMSDQAGWEVAEAGPSSFRATFAYDTPELLAAFPFPHALTLDVAVDGAALTVATTLRPTGERSVPVSFGFHPYLRLPGVGRDELVLRLPDRRHHLCLDSGLPTGVAEAEAAEADPLGERTFDDLYVLGDDRRLGIEGGGRRLTVELDEGYPWAQVFAPTGSDFVCLEPMTAPVNALVTGDGRHVGPGASFTATFTLRVERS